MHKNNTYSTQSLKILSAAILAAAWMIAGPDVLQKFSWHPKVVDLLTWVPAMTVFFWSISGSKTFLACERRAFKRLLGLS